LGARSFATGHRRAFADTGLAGQHYPALHGRDPDLAHGHDPENRRRHPAARHDVHSADLLIYLLQFCRGSGIVLHRAKPFSILQFYQNKKQPMPALEKVVPAGKTKRR